MYIKSYDVESKKYAAKTKTEKKNGYKMGPITSCIKHRVISPQKIGVYKTSYPLFERGPIFSPFLISHRAPPGPYISVFKKPSIAGAVEDWRLPHGETWNQHPDAPEMFNNGSFKHNLLGGPSTLYENW